MDKLAFLQNMQSNLKFSQEERKLDGGIYICPLGMRSFSDNKIKSCLTEEHVPQSSPVEYCK